MRPGARQSKRARRAARWGTVRRDERRIRFSISAAQNCLIAAGNSRFVLAVMGAVRMTARLPPWEEMWVADSLVRRLSE